MSGALSGSLATGVGSDLGAADSSTVATGVGVPLASADGLLPLSDPSAGTEVDWPLEEEMHALKIKTEPTAVAEMKSLKNEWCSFAANTSIVITLSVNKFPCSRPDPRQTSFSVEIGLLGHYPCCVIGEPLALGRDRLNMFKHDFEIVGPDQSNQRSNTL